MKSWGRAGAPAHSRLSAIPCAPRGGNRDGTFALGLHFALNASIWAIPPPGHPPCAGASARRIALQSPLGVTHLGVRPWPWAVAEAAERGVCVPVLLRRPRVLLNELQLLDEAVGVRERDGRGRPSAENAALRNPHRNDRQPTPRDQTSFAERGSGV